MPFFSEKLRFMDCFGLCTGVAANEAQFGDGEEHNEIDGVGVASSLSFFTSPPGNFSSPSRSFS